MPAFRLLLSVLAAIAVTVRTALVLLGDGTVPPVVPLIPDVPYAVDVAGDRATFTLPLSPKDRYVMVVSALGDASRTFDVSLEADDALTGRSAPLVPLADFEPQLRHRRPPASSDTSHATEAHPPSNREFFLHVTDGALDDPRQYTRVTARLIAERPGVRVYLDDQQTVDDLSPGLANEIAERLAEEIIPAYSDRVGACRDVDADGGLTVLLTPWLGQLQGGGTAVSGFVRGADFNRRMAPPFSNGCDMLYLNSNLRGGESLQALLAHELLHAVGYSVRLPGADGRNSLPPQEDWLNEALAHLGENLLSSSWANLDYRVQTYLDAPHQAPLVVADYYRAGRWRDHGCRGATYLFLRWCIEEYGDELLPALVHSPSCGVDALERETGAEFADLFRRWSIALVQQPAIGKEDTDASVRKTELPPVPLRGRLGMKPLSGPRIVPFPLDEGLRRLQLCGSSTAYVELTSNNSGPRRIRVRATPGARLQVTVIRRGQSQDNTGMLPAVIAKSSR